MHTTSSLPGPGDPATWGPCTGHPNDPRTEDDFLDDDTDEDIDEFFATDNPPRFVVDGNPPCSRADFLAANADSPDLCDWALTARPGDSFPAVVSCTCVPGVVNG